MSKAMEVHEAERLVIRAALADARCFCGGLVCKHLENLWSAADKLVLAMRKKGRTK